MYDFKTQLEIGKQIESELDRYFSRWYEIQSVSLEVEKTQGIDRIFISKATGEIKSVEYKSDFKSASTGNIYVELSVDSDNGYSKPGWAVHSVADIILYCIINQGIISHIYILNPSVVRSFEDIWKGQYRNVICKNKGYHSKGVLIPMDIVKSVSSRTIVLI
jgi:hypothetical protein